MGGELTGLSEASLWRDRSFQLYWAGGSVSIAGSAVTVVVLPILVFQLTGSASRTAVLLTIQAGPYLALGLLAGAVATVSTGAR